MEATSLSTGHRLSQECSSIPLRTPSQEQALKTTVIEGESSRDTAISSNRRLTNNDWIAINALLLLQHSPSATTQVADEIEVASSVASTREPDPPSPKSRSIGAIITACLEAGITPKPKRRRFEYPDEESTTNFLKEVRDLREVTPKVKSVNKVVASCRRGSRSD